MAEPPTQHRQARRRSPAERERATVRRALIAGGVTWALVGGGLIVGLAPAGGQASAVGLFMGLVFAGLVASAWLLVALAIDLWTRQPIGRRRWVWTAALTLATMISPTLVLGAGA